VRESILRVTWIYVASRQRQLKPDMEVTGRSLTMQNERDADTPQTADQVPRRLETAGLKPLLVPVIAELGDGRSDKDVKE